LNTSVSSQSSTSRSSRTHTLQLASAIKARRVQFLNMTTEQAAHFSGLSPEQWSALESGWLPAMDNTQWIWWTLAGSLQVKVDKLFRLASVDLAREQLLSRKAA